MIIIANWSIKKWPSLGRKTLFKMNAPDQQLHWTTPQNRSMALVLYILHILSYTKISWLGFYPLVMALFLLDFALLWGLVSLSFLIWMHFLFNDWKPPIESAQRDKNSTCVSNKSSQVCLSDKSHQILVEWSPASKEALFKQSFKKRIPAGASQHSEKQSVHSWMENCAKSCSSR